MFILQLLIKFLITLGATVGVIFMIACTMLVVILFIHGDIKVKITRTKHSDNR